MLLARLRSSVVVAVRGGGWGGARDRARKLVEIKVVVLVEPP
jgi:hypothetical protein